MMEGEQRLKHASDVFTLNTEVAEAPLAGYTQQPSANELFQMKAGGRGGDISC